MSQKRDSVAEATVDVQEHDAFECAAFIADPDELLHLAFACLIHSPSLISS